MLESARSPRSGDVALMITFCDARYPRRPSTETTYRPIASVGTPGDGAVISSVTFIPRVPDAPTRRSARARSGAVHEPLGVGSNVYGQYGL